MNFIVRSKWKLVIRGVEFGPGEIETLILILLYLFLISTLKLPLIFVFKIKHIYLIKDGERQTQNIFSSRNFHYILFKSLSYGFRILLSYKHHTILLLNTT